MVWSAEGRVMTTPEVVNCTTSSVQLGIAVPGPQLAALTGPKVNGTSRDGGVRVGGVAADSPNWFDEKASGQPEKPVGGVQLPAFAPSMKAVSRNVGPE